MHLVTVEEPARIAEIWQALERVVRPPYAMSWGWVETWLAAQGRVPPLHVVLDETGTAIAAAFEELPVLRTPALPPLGYVGDDVAIVVDREVTTAHVDLETVRAVEGGYLATRPAVVRAALLHARTAVGELALETATDPATAHAMLDALVAIDGAPDSPLLRQLVDRRAGAGEIQLTRVRRGDVAVAYFYDVRLHGHVAYQRAAFTPGAHRELCHVAAIEHAAARGFAFYELHPDDARLATGESRHLVLRLDRRDRGRLAG